MQPPFGLLLFGGQQASGGLTNMQDKGPVTSD
mgnify:CR=1 FL=1|jgi:hypothetical protein